MGGVLTECTKTEGQHDEALEPRSSQIGPHSKFRPAQLKF